MAWLVVDGRDNTEWIYEYKPNKSSIGDYWYDYGGDCIELPKGSIKKLIGKELNWNDEPVKLE